MKNIGKQQIEILKNEYRELREKVTEECRESQQKREVVEEVDGIMDSFVSKLEEGAFTDSEIDSYIETMGVVFRKDNNIDEDEEDYGEGTEDVQEILEDINKMMVSIFKAFFYSKLMCIFFN